MRRDARGGDPLAKVNLLELTPVRRAPWREQGDRVVLERPPVVGRGPRALLERLLQALSVRCIRLDEVGSCAWRLLDGCHTVGEVAAELRQHFGEAVEPAEERLGHLVRQLRQQGLLAYPEWDGE